MKLIIILFLFIPLNIVAQPGFNVEKFKKERFSELTKELKENPNNYELIWERINLSGFNNTYFDIYKENQIKYHLFYFKNSNELLYDLNKLINNNIVIGNHNIVEFKMLRGRLYYFSNELDKALEDYLSALNNINVKDTDLNDDIYISIAAYYYNLEDSLTEENARQTLKYLEKVNPNFCNSNQTVDCLEKEKKELLRFLKEHKQLMTYYKELILKEYERYVQVSNRNYETTDKIYFKNQYYFIVLSRINDLAEYYIELGKSEESKNLTNQVIKFLPPEKNRKLYKRFPKEKLYVISSEEYIVRYDNLHHKNQQKKLSWDYQVMTEFINSIKLK